MSDPLIVLDFDGTMTDAEAEAGPFREGYLDDIATLAGLPRDQVEALAARFDAEVAANPEREGWSFYGHIVAPATVDPYLRIMPVARRILDAAGVLGDEAVRTRLLDGVLYKHNYPRTRTVFRPGAAALLEALLPRPAWVVTNSHTEAVMHKIALLDATVEGAIAGWQGRVRGRARKYELDADWRGAPESITLPGLPRPVLLRRRAYFEVLDGLRREAGLGWADVRVVGDIFELDLALPWALGASVGLLANPHTPKWERAFFQNTPRTIILDDLDAAGNWLLGR